MRGGGEEIADHLKLLNSVSILQGCNVSSQTFLELILDCVGKLQATRHIGKRIGWQIKIQFSESSKLP